MPQIADITLYEQALIATESFLRQVKEEYWANWLQEDLVAWRKSRDVSHHRRAYGGMGSFNDVIISRMNEHCVSAEQEPWANSLFEWLKAILYYASANPTETPTVSELHTAVGRHAPSLSAFVGGEHAPRTWRGFADEPVKIRGARCLTCGYAALTPRDIDGAIADEFVPGLIFQACAQGTLADAIDSVLKLNLPDLDERREQLTTAATGSGITLSGREGWMSPCPNCQADDSAVYRWKYVAGSSPSLQPTSDNLPLRMQKTGVTGMMSRIWTWFKCGSCP